MSSNRSSSPTTPQDDTSAKLSAILTDLISGIWELNASVEELKKSIDGLQRGTLVPTKKRRVHHVGLRDGKYTPYLQESVIYELIVFRWYRQKALWTVFLL